MSLAPWRSSLARALHRNRSLVYARYLQLATVRPDGRPANRTIVFRGFLEDSDQLEFITDDRSEKIVQIQHQPCGEICWYFPITREQFRIAGLLSLIAADEPNETLRKARQTMWQNLSDAARLQFVWPPSGEVRSPNANFSPNPPDAIEPPCNFCLLLLDPTQVDHLELRGDPQNRYKYDKAEDGEWHKIEVNP
ncbi:pyridoxamine 5'-phosphate oxidase family protein [Microcoleus sp. FACHB-1515]|uniref:Npun_F5749 family FMN-dependent PPOX-type flavoprotein n=1 Tax=Cyanophyceae TaxID=3028117 RepID=UPI00168956EA|nr:Npun_F5749 family FMN-dependent PPOX-type flavoprotein [Microcoleus sp. FACHB-1515]MBD2090791.1 pyridoxamine 5'-phosphate oxidase family protein [Microcoleus sp. FACHB-1515]